VETVAVVRTTGTVAFWVGTGAPEANVTTEVGLTEAVTGLERVHGQSVMVRVVGAVTVYVLLPWVKTVGDGQTVVYTSVVRVV